MSEKSRYFKIGLFTMVSLALLCAGLIVFGAGSVFQEPPIVVETYFSNSVQGLDVGAFVKIRGVRVGKVRDILFVKDLYGDNKPLSELSTEYSMVCVKIEIESRFFPRLHGIPRDERQAIIDTMVRKKTMRAKLESIGITGLVYVELGFYDPEETPPPMEISWKPQDLYIPSAPGVTTRLGGSLDRLLNKMDSEIYPLIENLGKTSKEFPVFVSHLNAMMPHLEVISKNIADITSAGKKYPSQMLFGEAPPKSRFDR